MEVLNYHAIVIQSATAALENKYAVFSSFFNIESLIAGSSSHGLVFANRRHVLPGLKAVWLYGTRKLNQLKCRKSLNRIKKMTDLGRNVMKEERDLTEFSLHNSDNTADLDKAFERHSYSPDTITNFYFSNANAKRRRRLELSKSKYYHKLAAQERAFTQSKALIMFIGGCGYGVRSVIKGYQRFGGN
ncbi:hypothetical protein INT46_011319 [Mucor plumbeus]|uniref:Uncharacterized protein n=1 Tax=Mucor plumbeus TaxID=97098 RepID=A0A8H7QXV3_9FUNG|nr:hypothetical protein INT46_011319 [Mucor plumbeus]